MQIALIAEDDQQSNPTAMALHTQNYKTSARLHATPGNYVDPSMWGADWNRNYIYTLANMRHDIKRSTRVIHWRMPHALRAGYGARVLQDPVWDVTTMPSFGVKGVIKAATNMTDQQITDLNVPENSFVFVDNISNPPEWPWEGLYSNVKHKNFVSVSFGCATYWIWRGMGRCPKMFP